jgi:hypothetical protein
MISMGPNTTPGRITLFGSAEEWSRLALQIQPEMPGAANIIQRVLQNYSEDAWVRVDFEERMGRSVLRSTGASA